MKQIIDDVLKFQREISPELKARFQELSKGQHPQALFIGCSDSREVPELFMGQGPGELFVIRNAGNIVPPYGSAPNGTSASVEFAVALLDVPDVIVCGHAGCGAMTAILNGQDKLKELPEVAPWLVFSDAARRVVADHHAHATQGEKLLALVQQNVVAQLRNLHTHPVIATAVKAGKLRLHGWVFDISTATVTTYDAATDTFLPLTHSSAAGAKI